MGIKSFKVNSFNILAKIIIFWIILLSANRTYAHTVQIAYCITTEGKIRVYFEHWHGNLTVGQTADAQVQMIIIDGGTGIATPYSSTPAGVVWDTPIGSLSGCKSAMNVVSACGSANTYNDWAYWEFVPPACFVDLTIRITDVLGRMAYIFDPACGGIIPSALTDSFEDCVPPTVSCPSDITVEGTESGPCGETLSTELEPTVLFDDCTPNDQLVITYTITGARTDNGSGFATGHFPKGTSAITYEVEDLEGKVGTCTMNVTVDDTAVPSVTCPADLMVSCDDPDQSGTINNWLTLFNSVDSCDDSPINSNDYDSSTINQTVTFVATDGCTNVSTCQSTISIVDSDKPIIINCPNDLTIECGDPNINAILEIWADGATAVDGCDQNVFVSNNFSGVAANECAGVATVVFIATDGSGNSASCSATITNEDNFAPEFLMTPQDLTVDCINAFGNNPEKNIWLAANGNGMAQDACDSNVTWTNTAGTRMDGCGYTYSEEYTFTITDDCGNTSSATATFTVVDNTGPIMTTRADITQVCSVNNEANLLTYLSNGHSATDPCSLNGNITIDYVLYNDIPSCGGTVNRTYLFTATDECGNTGTDFFTYITTDAVRPNWSSPPGNLTLECGDEDNPSIIAQWIQDVEESMFDACGGTLTVSNNFSGNLPEGCNQNVTIIWTLTDECGNSRTRSRIIRVRDTMNPIFLNCPADMTVNIDLGSCGSNVVFSSPIVYDACSQGLIPSQTLGPASGSSFPLGTTLIRFEVRDECNQLTSCEFNITVIDTTTPSLSCPATVATCTIAGLCHWTSDDSVLPITGDICTAYTTEVEITGTTSLVRGIGTAENLDFEEGLSTVCYYVTTTATGSEASCCFDVIISDCEKPEVTCPADMTVECDGAGNTTALTTWRGTATATDNCSTSFTFSNQPYNTISGCGAAITTVYEFVATDESDNETQCLASFTIEDTTDPTITTAAINGDSDCDNANADLLDWLNDHGYAAATDVCGALEWSHDFNGGAMTACSGVTSVLVTFTVTDECGNTATTEAAFDVADTTVPSLTCPSNFSLECGNVLNPSVTELWLQSVAAADNCTIPTVSNNYPSGTTLACGETFTVTFTATDGCSNSSSCTSVINMEDTQPPVFIVLPQDLTLECDGTGNTAEIAANTAAYSGAVFADACTAAGSFTTLVSSTSTVSICGLTQDLVYSMAVSDECGNSVDADWTITIEDTTTPSVIAPADITVECANPLTTLAAWQAGASAADDCGTGFTFEAILFNTISACGNSKTEVYQFTATDACGNQGTALASYTIEDTTVPQLSCPPALTLACGDASNDLLIINWLQSATGSDGCGAVSFSEDFNGILPANCGGEVLTTFTVTDACNNTNTCTSTLSLDDVGTPDFVNCPNDLTINVAADVCGSNPIFSTPVPVDNCAVSVQQTAGIASGNTFPVGTTSIEFTATDECGNTQLCAFDLTVIDSEIPLILCPADLTKACVGPGSCSWVSDDLGPILGQENCPDFTIDYTITGATTDSGTDDASGTELALGISTICYTITDNSGASSTCCYEVTVSDCEAPVISCPTTQTFECDGAGNSIDLSTWLAGVSAVDNCATTVTINSQVANTISACGGGETTVYEFTATDDFGNTSVCSASFIVRDRIAPALVTAAEDLTVDCELGGVNNFAFLAWLNNNGGATATDLCSELTWSYDYTETLTELCGTTGARTVIFTAQDACGNQTMSSAVFSIRDITAPNISCPSSITIECGENNNAAIIASWLGNVSATDACSEVSITDSYPATLTAGCGDSEEYLITFTATDACANSSSCVAAISSVDSSVPEFQIYPQDLSLECGAANNPTLIAAWLAANGSAAATDNCGALVWTNESQTPIPSCGATETIPYIFTVTDACGNSSTALANIITVSTTAPVIIVPASLTVECDGEGNSAQLNSWLASLAGSSVCGAVSFSTNLYNSISACGGTSEQVYNFIVTDGCGNESSGLSSFIITDTTNPMPSCPPTLVVECGLEGNDQLVASWLLAVEVSEGVGCSAYELTHNYTGVMPSFLCDGDPGRIVAFTVTDDCGNSGQCQSLITLNDTTLPYFVNCPTDLTVNVDTDVCSSNIVYSQPVALDICDEFVAVELTAGMPSGTTFPLGATTIIFTATDECDNTVTCTFDITVEDSALPEIACPSNRVVVCTDVGSCEWVATEESSAIFSDNCGTSGFDVIYGLTGATTLKSPLTGVNDVDADNVIFNLGRTEVCYGISDGSGNAASCCFDIEVEDCEDPMLSCPADLVVECDGSGNNTDLMAWQALVVSTDNCDADPELSALLVNSISACGGTGVYVYDFSSLDDYDNEISCTAAFEIEDTTVPSIVTEAENLTVECSGTGNSTALAGWLNNVGGAAAIDLCDQVSWTNDYTADLISTCSGNSETTVVFTATDACGNTSTTSAIFTIEDTTAPIVNCPSNITIECGSGLQDAVIENWLNGASAIDACSEINLVNNYGLGFTTACGLTGQHLVAFTATDDCGNVNTCNSTITIEDTTAPTIEVGPTDLNLECADVNNATLLTAWETNFGGALASDLCADENLVWSIIDQVTVTACGNTTNTLYTFQVLDNCGNTSTTQASIIIADSTAPELTVPENQTEECNNIIVSTAAWLAEATGTDDCGTVTITTDLWNTTSGCGGTESETYLFIAADACGNETTGFADYLIEDTSTPTVICPAALALTCGNSSNDQLILNWLNGASSTDEHSCSTQEITNDYPTNLPALTCNGGTGIVVTFTVTDACSNTNSCSSTISMDDTTAPYFGNCPLDLFVNVDADLCATNVIYSRPLALDACDEDVSVVLTTGIASGAAFPIGTTTLLFTATDDCGNIATCEFDVTVVDSEIPSIDCPSNAVKVCTDTDLCSWEATDLTSATFAENCFDEGYTIAYGITGQTTASSPMTGINDVAADMVVFNLGASSVCYTITDEAANSAQCCFNVIVEDCQDPTINCPADLVVECDGSGNISELGTWLGTVSGSDNCIGDITFSNRVDNTISACGSTYAEVYEFSATDAAGNIATCYAQYKIEDTVLPVIVNDVPFATTVQCDGESNLADFIGWLQNNAGLSTVTEACGNYEWHNDYTAGSDEVSGCNGADRFFRIDVNFWVVDECGNESIPREKRWRVEDTEMPVLTCPQSIVLECDNVLNDLVIANWLTTATSEDACQSSIEVTNNYGDVTTENCGLTVLHTVTFATIDQCGNGDSCERTITIQDITDPTIEAEATDLILECSADDNATLIATWTMNNGYAVASDACADEPLVWTILSQTELDDCGITSSGIYTFQVEDNCGNTSTTRASVILEDTTPPELTVPENQVEECAEQVVDVATWQMESSATDDCGTVSIVSDLWNTTSGCGATETQTYLFTATDACGNETTGFADYIIVDTNRPTIVCPPELPLTCGNESNDQIILNWLNAASSTDDPNCSEQEITSDYPGSLPTPACPMGSDIIVTFTATDACSNTRSCTSTITIEDVTSPYFSNCPLPMTVNVDVDLCETNVVYSQPVALDNCDENVTVVLTNGIASGATFPIGLTTILFTASDACDNTSTCEVVITVEDSDTPSIDCPSNAVYVCTDVAACTWEATEVSSAIFAENCADEGYTVSYTVTGATVESSPLTGINDVDTDNITFDLGTSTVCYTITDEASNTAMCCFDIIVEDCEDPSIDCPTDLTVECDGAANTSDLATWLGTVTAADNCDVTVTITNSIFNTISACGKAEGTVYEFIAEDNFGNTTTCQAVFAIEDTTDPELDTEAQDLTVECSDSGNSTSLLAWLNNAAGAAASDVCNDLSWSNDYTVDLASSCGETGEITVTFTATDACDNAITTEALFTIEDTTSPDLSCPENLELECGVEINDAIIANWLSTALATDLCSAVTVTNNYEEVFAGACGATGMHTVTFNVIDACDNQSACDRTITIVDTTDPIISVLAQDLVLECAHPINTTEIATWVANFGGAAATDNCADEPLVWSVVSQVVLSNCGNTETTIYTFQVTDNCSNSATTTASVIIEDTTAPTLVVPEDQVEECNAVLVDLATWQAEAAATDLCGTTTINAVLWNSESACGGTAKETYLFTATDACGNSTTGFASYELEDTSEPTAICPAALPLICGEEANDQIILAWLNSATATDEYGCSAVELSSGFPAGLPVLTCDDGLGTEVIFTATDACGNTNTCVSTITRDDVVAPYFSNCPISITVNTDSSLPCQRNLVYSQPIALDNCDEAVDVTLVAGVPSGNPFPLGTTTITFEAGDDCGNTSTCTFNITVVDTGVPSISCPSNDVVVCTDAAACTWLATDQTDPIYNDNCPGLELTYEITGVTMNANVVSGVNTIEADAVEFSLGESAIIYTITDPSGNSATCSFDLIVNDCENPDLTCNDQLNIACGAEDLSAWFESIAATTTDNCSALTELALDTLLLTDFSSCGSTFSRVYLFTVIDEAGNTATCTATYETDDNIAAIINTEAEDLTIECTDGIQATALLAWLNNNGGATATDACSEPVLWTNDFTGDLTGTCGTNGGVTVVFTARDDCGNSSTSSAVFTIEDTTAPTLSCPENLVLECAAGLNTAVIANWLRTANAIDACEGKTLITQDYPDAYVGACGATGEFTITFTTTDACANLSSCNRTITIEDTTSPALQRQAQNLELSCGSATITTDINAWLAVNGEAQATDACSDEPLIWTNAILQTEEGCGAYETTTYLFTVTDNCGNSTTTTATVIINDDTSPTFDPAPATQVIECYPTGNEVALMNWLNNNGGGVAVDLCATNFEWEYDLINVIDNCGNTNIRVYRFTVSDECGNTTTAEATFEIHDTTNPELTDTAEDFTTECNGFDNSFQIIAWLNNNGGAAANDRCGSITWSNNYGTVLADCGATGGVEVVFTATDDCGNSSTTSANFIINDESDPTWLLLPQNLEVECDGSDDPMGQIEAWLNTAGGGEATDDCSAITYSNDFSVVDLVCDMQGGVEVVFTVTDACSNFSTATALLIITDDTAPIITLQAQNETVECDGAGNTNQLQAWLDRQADAVAEDACSASLVWTYNLNSALGSCGSTVTNLYEFTATDACGNVSASSLAAFIIEDTSSPTFAVLPQNATVECDGQGNDAALQAWLDLHANALAEDICSSPITWAYDLVRAEDSCSITGTQVYRFTITDDCGNEYSEEASFIIEDTTEPDLVAGADMNMEECEANVTGNLLDFDFWLDTNAGATASDICSQLSWTNDYHPDNWVTTCGNTSYVDVLFTVTDACGNRSETTHRFGIGDVTPPEFINCPRPPVVSDAPDTWCSAYVNYATPVAEDNCSSLTVTQVEGSGLQSGDLFPVGLTIITFVAEDVCGNSSSCELKIIVNDFHTPPSIVCPESVAVENNPSLCGAIVSDLAPVNVSDNCPDNLSLLYTVKDESGNTIASGFEDASGTQFPVGTSTVEYTVYDQSLVLITEVLQDGQTTGVELTNFGPATLDLSCLDIVRAGPDNESHNIPKGTVVPVGATYTQLFSTINPATAAGYYLSFVGTIIDGVAINGYSSSSYAFSGNIFAENIYRSRVSDHDSAADFEAATACFPGSFGDLNPGLTTMHPNGVTVSLQEAVPSRATCSFEVVVADTEPAYCAAYDTTRVCLLEVESLTAESCTALEFAMPAGVTVADVNLIGLNIGVSDAAELSFELTSPQGTTVQLFSQLCPNTADIDLSLDDTADLDLTAISCGPLGQGNVYQPIGDFSAFFDEAAGGLWTLHVTNRGSSDAVLLGVCLEVLELVPYAQEDVYLENDFDQCGANYTWQHPQVSDNCAAALMTVTYESDNNISLPASGDVATGTIASAFFEVGTTRVVYTILDQFGNKSICGFEIVVEDTQLPLLVASECQDQTIQLAANQCFVPSSALGLPPLIDNCGSANLSFSPNATSGLPSGDHPITLGFTDAFGNTTQCNMMITVLPFEPPSDQMVCQGQVNVSLGADCEVQLSAAMMLAPGGMHGCTEDYCLTVTDPQGNEVENNIATEEHIGQLLTVKVCTDCNGGNCCWGKILIENKLTPSINCPEPKVTIVCNQAFVPAVVGEPLLESCEQEVYFSYEDNITFGDMCDDFPGSIQRIWTVTDESNNTIQCTQEITLERFDITAVEFPEDTIITTADLSCADVAEQPELIHPAHTGYPTMDGVPISETGEGLCSHFWNWDDQILFNCEGSYEILRQWLVRDMCSEIDWGTNPIEYYQSIKVIDNMPPQFEGCQNETVIARADFDCSTDVYLNDLMPEITDVCGSVQDTVFSVSPGTIMERPANSGNYYLTNMAPGIHTVKITVKDQCSNYNRCSFDIEVEDKTGPQVICEQDLQVALNSSGVTELAAEILDDGSYDNCTGIEFQIYRMDEACGVAADLEPGRYITLCCNDVSPEPMQLMMRAWDDADTDGIYGTSGDYFSECMVRVYVSDATLPELTCPEKAVIACNQDYQNLSLTGRPSIGSACSFVDADFADDISSLTECNTGTVIRTWNIIGSGIACKQTIEIAAAMPFTVNDIVWPSNYEGDCSAMNTAAEPIINTPDCSQVLIKVKSDTFYFSGAACYKVVNSWEVIDWCQYDSAIDPNIGKWTHQQEIKITSSVAPAISGCGDVFVDVLSADCSVAEVTVSNSAIDNSCGKAQLLNWSYSIDVDEDGMADYEDTYSGLTPSVTISNVPNGTMDVIWQVTDGCGNSASCSQKVFPVDGKNPTAYCQSIATAVMDATGTVELWVSDLDAGSLDNCTASEGLVLSFDANTELARFTYDCSDLENGLTTTLDVILYVTDEAGNQSNCVAQVTLQDNNDACPDEPGMMMIVGGEIKTEFGERTVNVETYLQSNTIGTDMMALTDTLGAFYFSQVATGQAYLLAPYKNDDHLNGLSTRDMIFIQRHALGSQLLDTPYKLIAADITGDEKINGLDLVQLRKLILGQIDSFHTNTSWRFVDDNFLFVNPMSPFPFDESILINSTNQMHMDNDFVAVKIGDVDNSIDLGAVGSGLTTRSSFDLFYSLEAKSKEHKKLIPVFSNDRGLIYGFQFTLELEKGLILDVLPGSIDFNEEHYLIRNGSELAFSWSSEHGAVSDVTIPLFYISVDEVQPEEIVLSLMKQNPKAEIYVGKELATKVPSLSLYDDTGKSQFVLYQNEPNPFKEFTEIRFFLPEAQEVSLSFFNTKGTKLYSIINTLEEGEHSYKLNAELFKGENVVYYQLSTELYTDSKKMIIVK